MYHPKLNIPRAEIHPALRESPALVGLDDITAQNTQYLHSFLQLADMKIEGGGDKVAMPIFGADGVDVLGVQKPKKRSPKVPIRSLPGANDEEKSSGVAKYTLFPTIEHNGQQRMTPMKVKARRSSSALGEVSYIALSLKRPKEESSKNQKFALH